MTKRSYSSLLFAGALSLLLICIIEAESISQATHSALLLCSRSIIPSLLPSLVVSGMLVSAVPNIHIPFGNLFSKVFNLPQSAVCPFLLGVLCGFPIGVRATADLYQKGFLAKDEAARCAALSANTGPAFCVVAVGGGMFSNVRIGWWLYLLQILSAIILGILTRNQNSPHRATAIGNLEGNGFSLSAQLSNAALTLLSVCATVCFFGAICAPITKHLSPASAAVISALLEVGNGCWAAAQLPNALGISLATLALSFSGISVLLQSASVLSPSNIPLAPLIFRKIAQGLLSVLLSLLAFPIILR